MKMTSDKENPLKGLEKSEKLLDEYFPKGDKRRGQALALFGMLANEAEQKTRQEVEAELQGGFIISNEMYRQRKFLERTLEVQYSLQKEWGNLTRMAKRIKKNFKRLFDLTAEFEELKKEGEKE